jgi:RpiB/LacA/LacB family sugar-phosphate isomerase
MIIYLGADHRGVQFKEKVKKILLQLGYSFVDFGTNDETVSCDYPKVAYKVASAVAKDKKSFGILVCMSGIGQAIVANKVKGAYAALCYNSEAATLSRQHNNANVMVLSAKFIKPSHLKLMVKNFLTTDFEGGRHLRRFHQIQAVENNKKI